MYRSLTGFVLAAIAVGVVVLAGQTPPPRLVSAAVRHLAITPGNVAGLRQWEGRIRAMERAGLLQARKVRVDTVLDGRVHERYDQYAGGVRVVGGDIVQQTRQGVTESVFGTIHERVALSTIPRFSADEARDRFAALAGRPLPPHRVPELVILPRDEGGYALTWRARVWTSRGWMHTFLDAQTGAIVLQYNDQKTQAAVGTGTGVLGDRKKISTRQMGSVYVADDQLRPPTLITYDVRGDYNKAYAYLFGAYEPVPSDFATDGDNTWSDGANVDAHVHLGWTYDYYFKRFGRKGLDDNESPIYALTHPARRDDLESLPSAVVSDFLLNAFWCTECGPAGRGAIVFGDGIPEEYVLVDTDQHVNYFAGGLDVVAHELTHGLTDYSSVLEYRNEPGALNEAFSDIVGTSVEFFYHAAGSAAGRADYLVGEDIVTPGAIRSMADPLRFGDPDHYSRRYLGTEDSGGVHTNSGIPNQAFYLAIEGGVNRTSGLRVTGVGAANREQIERAFYRAFTFMLTSRATFSMARAATIQSARELYGAGSAAERAITEAWTAIGVN